MDDDSVAIFPCKLPVKMVINCSWYGQWHCSTALQHCSTGQWSPAGNLYLQCCDCSLQHAAYHCTAHLIPATHFYSWPELWNLVCVSVSPQGRDVCKHHATADLQWTLANKYWDSSMILWIVANTRYYLIKYRFIINPKVEIQCNLNAMLFKVDRWWPAASRLQVMWWTEETRRHTLATICMAASVSRKGKACLLRRKNQVCCRGS